MNTYNGFKETYKGPLPKTLERFRPIIRDISDERGLGDGYWVYLLGRCEADNYTTAHGHCWRELRSILK